MNPFNETLQIAFVISVYLLVIIPLLAYCINTMVDDFITFLTNKIKREEKEKNESKRGK